MTLYLQAQVCKYVLWSNSLQCQENRMGRTFTCLFLSLYFFFVNCGEWSRMFTKKKKLLSLGGHDGGYTADDNIYDWRQCSLMWQVLVLPQVPPWKAAVDSALSAVAIQDSYWVGFRYMDSSAHLDQRRPLSVMKMYSWYTSAVAFLECGCMLCSVNGATLFPSFLRPLFPRSVLVYLRCQATIFIAPFCAVACVPPSCSSYCSLWSGCV